MNTLTKKIILLLSATLIVTLLWFAGLQQVYARVLTFSTNTVLTAAGRASNIQTSKQDGTHVFHVNTFIDGNRAEYPLKYGTILLPTVMMLAWIAFTPFFRKRKAALKSSIIVFLAFLFTQVVFLLLLTAYYTSATAHFFYNVMQDGFYIIALGIIIIDNLVDQVF